ncbi:hypothetical protein SAMN04488548_134686 [Gordonia westfalica]|uniref:DUF5642 domain-containing protein n=1 Tax=Gordonia westfalica TaxID=158898 RepID=A0A1H2HUQ7_9ACTN|nr:hypothetical protein SAMN04488548_134686 [Gordonia westfalica]
MLAAACAVLAGGVLSACSVGGDAQPSNPDLSSRSVSASDFPTPASPIPPQAVANALADITGSPSPGQGSNTEISPSECAPPPVSADGAVAFLGPGTAERSTLTTVVAHVDTPLAEVVRRAEKCPELTTTTFGASSTVTTEVLPAPPARDGVETATIRRTILTGGGTVPTTTSSLSLIGERDGVRVYAEYRWPAAGPVPAEDSAALDELFTKAVSAAFG